ncbi:MAG: transporter substrate-binding domain-containing protein [Natronincolaceae bacterium]|mgnify:CR=1 FL=1|jgi:putative lysine transport system substrate-binding protein|nr:transporter substrate-binding domain-containing protein [Bacillota bacterium]NLK89987.1 transporter substrate-binding domain-containing protein [Clostridiales bacterium]
MNKKLTLMIVIALILSMLLVGCWGKGNTPTGQEGEENGDVSAGQNETGEANGSAQGEKEVFRVGLEADYAPFNWTQMDSSKGAVKIDGSPEYAGGYDVEIAKIIAEGLGKELVIVKIDWDGLVPALISNKIDAIIAGMSPTDDRKETIDFSDNYYKSDLVMVVKKGSKYENATSIQDFNGAKITAQLNTFHYTVIDQIKGVKKEAPMDTFPVMRVAIESGILDGYVSERPEAVSAVSANKNFAMVEFTDGFETSDDDTAIAVGVRKGDDELREKINEILAGFTEEDFLSIMNTAIKDQPAEQE